METINTWLSSLSETISANPLLTKIKRSLDGKPENSSPFLKNYVHSYLVGEEMAMRLKKDI